MNEDIQPFRIEIRQADVDYLGHRSPAPAGPASCSALGGPAEYRLPT